MSSSSSFSSVLASKADATLKSAASKAHVSPIDVSLKARVWLQGHFSKIVEVSWAPDGSLVSAAQDGKLIRWNAATGSKEGIAFLQCEYVMTIDCCQGPSQLIALGGMDNLITLHAPSSLKRSPDGSAASAPSASLQAHSGFISSVTFFAGDKLFSTSGDSTAMIWDIHQQAASHAFKGSTGQGLTCGAPQPDAPAMFVTCEVDGHIQLWDSRAATAPVIVFQQQQSASNSAASAVADVNAISFLPANAAAFASAHDDGICRIWDLRSSCAVGQLHEAQSTAGAATALCLSSSGRVAFVGHADGSVKVWDLLLEEVSSTFLKAVRRGSDVSSGSPFTRNRISDLKLSPDGLAVACSSWDKTLRIFA